MNTTEPRDPGADKPDEPTTGDAPGTVIPFRPRQRVEPSTGEPDPDGPDAA